jgi:predicted nucleotidyltransferase
VNIFNEDIRKIGDIAHRYDLMLVVLFGSRAKGLARDDSDTDIAVKATRLLETRDILKLEAEFDNIFKSSEVVDLRTAPVLLLANIARDGVLLFESKQSIFTEFKIQAFNQYIEYKPYLEKRKQMIKSKVAGF